METTKIWLKKLNHLLTIIIQLTTKQWKEPLWDIF